MSTTTVTSAGQVTLPEEVREHLHLVEGDRVEFIIETDGQVHLRPASSSVRELAGFLHRPDLPSCTVEEMTENMARYIAEDNERIRKGED